MSKVGQRRGRGLVYLFGPTVTTLALFASCGGHGGGTTPVTDPLISDLNLATSSQTCTAQGFPGHVRTVSFNYADPEGDVRGGHVDLGLVGANTPSLTVAVPSNNATLSGTTSGAITISPVCIAVIGGTATLTASLTDAAGHTSNTLSTGVSGLQARAPAESSRSVAIGL